MPLHSSLTENHVPYAYSYANASARTGASGFVAGDVGKIAYQQDTKTLWILTAATPTWRGISEGTFSRAIVFGFAGALTVGPLNMRVHALWAGTISNVRAAVNTAPVDASLILDVNLNGTTIFTTQGNRPTILTTATDDATSTPDVVSFVAGDIFTVDVDQIGSTTPGSDLVLTIEVVPT